MNFGYFDENIILINTGQVEFQKLFAFGGGKGERI
jgi:hypothetical protein